MNKPADASAQGEKPERLHYNSAMASPPRFRSLRWKLPMSYAAIALLAVLALGIGLLGTLRGFYRQQELAYLTGNAAAIAGEIEPLLGAGDWPLLQSQIAGYSLLTQTRVQVLDETGQTVLADSGDLEVSAPAIAVSPGEDGLLDIFGVAQEEVVIVVEEEAAIDEEEEIISSQRTITRTSRVPAQGSLYGFDLGVEPTAVSERSSLATEIAIIDPSGAVQGRVRLSQGPAYGASILRSVAWGWAFAGTVAVAVAALIGWLASRRLTRPLLDLTAITERMAAGDLGARADVHRADELGILGSSFNQMAEQVEDTVDSLRQFTADAAHELHTPLTGLQTDLHLLAGGDDPDQQRRVARAQNQALRLQDLVDNLLELSRLEAESGRRERPLFNLTQLVQKTGELYASRAEQAGLDFELQLSEQQISIRGEESQIQRALANVLDNSLKFTPAPGKIALSLSAENETAVILVHDTGIGILPEDMPQLFTRFHRGRNTAGYDGSGLGLAIVQEIMDRHGGRVAVESNDGRTEVRLILRKE